MSEEFSAVLECPFQMSCLSAPIPPFGLFRENGSGPLLFVLCLLTLALSVEGAGETLEEKGILFLGSCSTPEFLQPRLQAQAPAAQVIPPVPTSRCLAGFSSILLSRCTVAQQPGSPGPRLRQCCNGVHSRGQMDRGETLLCHR